MDYEEISYQRVDQAALITLDRPKVLNAVNDRMRVELLDAFDRIDADDRVRVGIVTGRGRAFCSGADVSEGAETFDLTGKERPAGSDTAGKKSAIGSVPWNTSGQLVARLFSLTKPVIAAINGPAIGLGATLPLPMDIKLVSETASLSFIFTRRGLVPEGGSSWFLPRLVGMNRAAEWIYSGKSVSAREALESGLVRSMHRPGDLVTAALELATDLATDTSPVAVALSRQLLWRMLVADHPMEANRADARANFFLGATDEVREGVQAFIDRRSPQFTLSTQRDLPNIFPGWVDPQFY